jgi:hypothetical protein
MSTRGIFDSSPYPYATAYLPRVHEVVESERVPHGLPTFETRLSAEFR